MSKLAIKRSFVIALVVGTLLNIINQYDALLLTGSVNFFKVILTYCVPFCVSLFSVWLSKRDALV
ncbi:nitrate/nitrite transporter NrtS [Vibrio salilacus]|uniref:nitrate/nitrite transporter NrtS n=1 Tax=Vibrio salilacus TaxID=1323749 RepID=UPI000C29B937|nr:nitrate/nitrite transporter NrtS [Vibrio salilacus]